MAPRERPTEGPQRQTLTTRPRWQTAPRAAPSCGCVTGGGACGLGPGRVPGDLLRRAQPAPRPPPQPLATPHLPRGTRPAPPPRPSCGCATGSGVWGARPPRVRAAPAQGRQVRPLSLTPALRPLPLRPPPAPPSCGRASESDACGPGPARDRAGSSGDQPARHQPRTLPPRLRSLRVPPRLQGTAHPAPARMLPPRLRSPRAPRAVPSWACASASAACAEQPRQPRMELALATAWSPRAAPLRTGPRGHLGLTLAAPSARPSCGCASGHAACGELPRGPTLPRPQAAQRQPPGWPLQRRHSEPGRPWFWASLGPHRLASRPRQRATGQAGRTRTQPPMPPAGPASQQAAGCSPAARTRPVRRRGPGWR